MFRFISILTITLLSGLFSQCSSQSGFEKYYNQRSDYFSDLPGERQDSNEGLAILLEIEENFNKLSPTEHKKFKKRMGDTFLMTALVLSIQNKPDSSFIYLDKWLDARGADLNLDFVNGAKGFNHVRNDARFAPFMEKAKNQKAVSQPDLFTVKVSVRNLKKDIDVLQKVLEEAHQSLYLYTPQEQLDRAFDNARTSIKSEMTQTDFYKVIAPLVATIKDGHTSVNFPITPSSLKCQIPLSFKVIDGNLFVSKSFDPKYDYLIGKQIEKINGVAASELIKFALTHFSSDGDNTTHQLFQLQNPYRFANVLTLLTGRLEKNSVVVSGDSQPITVFNTTRDSLRTKIQQAEAAIAPIDFKTIDKNTALLSVRSFSASEYEKRNIRMREFLTTMLTSLAEQKTKNLIIDVRGNGGGEDVFGRMLYACFAEKEFQYYASLTIKKDDYDLFEYIEGGQRKMPEDFAVKNSSGTWDVTKKYNLNVGQHTPFAPRYTGNIYVLMDGGCFSTTSEFLSHLHANTTAIFIGEESGGNYYSNNSGIIAEVVLPNSQLTVSIPMLKYVLAVPQNYPHKRNGIIPHHTISTSVEDLKSGTDSQLNFTLNLLDK